MNGKATRKVVGAKCNGKMVDSIKDIGKIILKMDTAISDGESEPSGTATPTKDNGSRAKDKDEAFIYGAPAIGIQNNMITSN